jgi:nitroimidazol reductase NimA-like FMN-containing flavoprotein (pyridoxamine 5'-phosphate oxidase superfamily)
MPVIIKKPPLQLPYTVTTTKGGTAMRRTDREVRGIDALYAIMRRCDVCHLALFDEEDPYVIPLNFGVELQDGRVTLYFHCAPKGRKLDLLAANPHIAFSMSCNHELRPGDRACDYGMNYASVCGNGRIEVVDDDDEKIHALAVLMENYAPGETFEFDGKMVAGTTLLKLSVQGLTGKRVEL